MGAKDARTTTSDRGCFAHSLSFEVPNSAKFLHFYRNSSSRWSPPPLVSGEVDSAITPNQMTHFPYGLRRRVGNLGCARTPPHHHNMGGTRWDPNFFFFQKGSGFWPFFGFGSLGFETPELVSETPGRTGISRVKTSDAPNV